MKRVFEILDNINLNDTLNKTENLGVCFDLVSLDYKPKQGGTYVIIGAPGNVVNDIGKGKTKAMLLLLDMNTYSQQEYTKTYTSPDAVKALDMVGKVYMHNNGLMYVVTGVSNLDYTPAYPITIIYRGLNDNTVWSMPLSDWDRSLTLYIEKS